MGSRSIRAKIAFEHSVILTRCVSAPLCLCRIHTHCKTFNRNFVWEIMQVQDRDSFALREPTAKKVFRVAKYPIGIHQRWSCDGHDKLYKIGFPVWAIVDDATGKILKVWVVPSNRLGDIIGYLYLCLVEEFEGKSDPNHPPSFFADRCRRHANPDHHGLWV